MKDGFYSRCQEVFALAFVNFARNKRQTSHVLSLCTVLHLYGLCVELYTGYMLVRERREYLIKKAKVCLIQPNLIRKKKLAADIKWHHCNTLRVILLFIKT